MASHLNQHKQKRLDLCLTGTNGASELLTFNSFTVDKFVSLFANYFALFSSVTPPLIFTSAEEGGYVFGSVCLSVCLFVCLSVGLLANL